MSLDPTVGAEIRKTRPAVVVQNDPANRRSPITIVAAVTSQFEEPLYPTEVLVRAPEGGLTVDSVVLLNQIRSVDKGRLVRRLPCGRNCSRIVPLPPVYVLLHPEFARLIPRKPSARRQQERKGHKSRS